MKLRSDDYKGPPLIYMLFLPEHKIGSYYTKSGYEAEVNQLKKLIKSDVGLFHSTTWATRVIYPKTLEGQELFKIIKTENGNRSFIQRLLRIAEIVKKSSRRTTLKGSLITSIVS